MAFFKYIFSSPCNGRTSKRSEYDYAKNAKLEMPN